MPTLQVISPLQCLGEAWLINGILQGLSLGPALTNIVVSAMDTGIEDTLRKLAAHTKLVCVVSMLQGRNAIQRDIDRFERLVCANLMKFNRAKCKVVHWGWGNPKYIQTGQRMDWEQSEEEGFGDVGWQEVQHISALQTCSPESHHIQGCLRSAVASRTGEVIMSLYSVLVRPHLAYCIHLA